MSTISQVSDLWPQARPSSWVICNAHINNVYSLFCICLCRWARWRWMVRSRLCAKVSSVRWSLRRWTLSTCLFLDVSGWEVTATYEPSIRAARRTRTGRYCPRHLHGPPPPSGPFRAAQVRIDASNVHVPVWEFTSLPSSTSNITSVHIWKFIILQQLKKRFHQMQIYLYYFLCLCCFPLKYKNAKKFILKVHKWHSDLFPHKAHLCFLTKLQNFSMLKLIAEVIPLAQEIYSLLYTV